MRTQGTEFAPDRLRKAPAPPAVVLDHVVEDSQALTNINPGRRNRIHDARKPLASGMRPERGRQADDPVHGEPRERTIGHHRLAPHLLPIPGLRLLGLEHA